MKREERGHRRGGRERREEGQERGEREEREAGSSALRLDDGGVDGAGPRDQHPVGDELPHRLVLQARRYALQGPSALCSMLRAPLLCTEARAPALFLARSSRAVFFARTKAHPFRPPGRTGSGAASEAALCLPQLCLPPSFPALFPWCTSGVPLRRLVQDSEQALLDASGELSLLNSHAAFPASLSPLPPSGLQLSWKNEKEKNAMCERERWL